MTADFFDAIVLVAEDYLGPSAKRFISRQICFHLNKKPEEIVPADLPPLVEWVKTALSLLTDDQSLVEEFEAKMKDLTRQFA